MGFHERLAARFAIFVLLSTITDHVMNTPRRIRTLLDLFSSVRFGIVLLTLLLVYTSIG